MSPSVNLGSDLALHSGPCTHRWQDSPLWRRPGATLQKLGPQGLPKPPPSALGSAGHRLEVRAVHGWREQAGHTGPCSAVSLAHPLQAPQLLDGGLPRPQRRKEHKWGQPSRGFLCWQGKGAQGAVDREAQPPPHRECTPMSPGMGGDHCVYSCCKRSLLPWGPAGTCLGDSWTEWRHLTALPAHLQHKCQARAASGHAFRQPRAGLKASVPVAMLAAVRHSGLCHWASEPVWPCGGGGGHAGETGGGRAEAQQVGGRERGKGQPPAGDVEPVTRSIQTHADRERQFVQTRACDPQGLPEQAEDDTHRALSCEGPAATSLRLPSGPACRAPGTLPQRGCHPLMARGCPPAFTRPHSPGATLHSPRAGLETMRFGTLIEDGTETQEGCERSVSRTASSSVKGRPPLP